MIIVNIKEILKLMFVNISFSLWHTAITAFKLWTAWEILHHVYEHCFIFVMDVIPLPRTACHRIVGKYGSVKLIKVELCYACYDEIMKCDQRRH